MLLSLLIFSQNLSLDAVINKVLIVLKIDLKKKLMSQ